jgi:short-subunit dehydrogenase
MAKKFKPRPIEQQVVVITDAISGIGFATAELAAQKGARVVLAARNEDELNKIAQHLEQKGASILPVVCDVRQEADLKNLCDKTRASFGVIDAWINNAGLSLYGYLLDSENEKERDLFETNFWGTLLGSKLAIKEMQERGGVLINLGSEVSVAAQPLLGIYSATKHAVKAITEALRIELRDRQIPIEVCLIRPTAIDTPFADHAKDLAAESIVHCLESPQRDVYVGGPAKMLAILDTFLPHVKDIFSESQMKDLKKVNGERKLQSDGHNKESSIVSTLKKMINQGRAHEKKT